MNLPDQVISRALDAPGNQPIIRRLCLTSGGGDSTVLAHACVDHYDELCHIDTGTALPGVREFVEQFAAYVGKPLRVVEAGDAYRRLVLGDDRWWGIYHACRLPDEEPDAFRDRTAKLPTRVERMAMGLNVAPMGFPGPAGHKFAYQRLKERQLEQALRDVKREYGNGRQKQRVALLSGVRMDESARRKMTGAAQGEWERRGNQVWVNPLLDWTNEEMRAYRKDHALPVSDVTALIHKSGECQCLAFAAKGEREFIISLFPEWYAANIRPIEDAAQERGLKHWQWGWGAGVLHAERPEASGPMCQACDLAQGTR